MRLRLTCEHCGHTLLLPAAEELIDQVAEWFGDAHIPHLADKENILVTEQPETLLFTN